MPKPLVLEQLPLSSLRPYGRNARTHSVKQIAQIAASIRTFGFNNPVLIDKDSVIIAGHGRVEAAKQLGLDRVPVIRLEHLSEDQKRLHPGRQPARREGRMGLRHPRHRVAAPDDGRCRL